MRGKQALKLASEKLRLLRMILGTPMSIFRETKICSNPTHNDGLQLYEMDYPRYWYWVANLVKLCVGFK